MRPTVEDGLHALREATELARQIQIDLTDDYLRYIELVEALPQNQSGSDKTWLWRADQAFRRGYAQTRRVAVRP